MPTKSKKTDLDDTPLGAAAADAYLLAANLYFSLLFQESIDAQLEMERDYQILLQDGKPEDIQQKREQLDYADSLLGLNILYTIGEGLES